MRTSKFVTVSLLSLMQALLVVGVVTSKPALAHADTSAVAASDENALDELDPFDPSINEKLEQMDRDYEDATGLSPYLNNNSRWSMFGMFDGCYRQACPVYAHVSKSAQRLTLYVNGQEIAQWPTSTGVPGRGTPDFDRHPDGRIYDAYTSAKFPGGDYNGLGNMPYAVFITGGFAIHGTARSNWPKLGHVASHGCIRIHPDNAYRFNRLVRQYGVSNTWITVEN